MEQTNNTTETKKRRDLYKDIKVLSDFFEFVRTNHENPQDFQVILSDTQIYKDAKAIVDFHSESFAKRNNQKIVKVVSRVESMTQAEKQSLANKLKELGFKI